MKSIISTEICKKCGECCKNFPYIEMTKNEIILLEEVTALPFDVFTNAKGLAGEEYFLQFQANGHCFFLEEKNGGYICGVYESRPGICKNYPSKPKQKEACFTNRKKSLSFDSG